MSTARTARIAAQIQRSLATLLQRGVKDPRVGKVTVTAVRLIADLSVAHVFVLPFGALPVAAAGGCPQASDKAAEQMLTGLRSAAGFLRGQIGRELALRQAPRLQFELDTQLTRAHELTELIERAVAADGAPRDDSGDGGSTGEIAGIEE